MSSVFSDGVLVMTDASIRKKDAKGKKTKKDISKPALVPIKIEDEDFVASAKNSKSSKKRNAKDASMDVEVKKEGTIIFCVI